MAISFFFNPTNFKYKLNSSKIQHRKKTSYKILRSFLRKVIFLRVFKANPKFTYIYISSSYRNVHLTVTDYLNKILFRVSAGSTNNATYKKALRKKPFPAFAAGEEVAKKLLSLKRNKVVLILRGLSKGKGRKSAIQGLEKHKMWICAILNKTSHPHNGCRKSKKRRL